MSSPGRELFCPRCDSAVRAIEPWPHWKLLWNIWKVGLVGVLVFFPFLASDFCVMLPSTMLFLVAGGILRSYAKEMPVCRRCSLELDPKLDQGTAIRSRPPA